MTDLSSISSSSVDLVTVCLGLHLILPDVLPAVLKGIARGEMQAHAGKAPHSAQPPRTSGTRMLPLVVKTPLTVWGHCASLNTSLLIKASLTVGVG